MRILLFSDVHRDQAAVARLVELAAQADLLIGAGDFATCRQGLQPVIDGLRASQRPAIFVPGNSESDDELRAACRGWNDAFVLHGESLRLFDHDFFGLGAAIPVTPFGAWSFDLTEEDAATRLAKLPHHAIVVTHSPPRGLVDRDSRGRSLGSQAIRAAIETHSPLLVVCGHIHGSGGQTALLNQTTIINAGPAGIFWETPAEL